MANESSGTKKALAAFAAFGLIGILFFGVITAFGGFSHSNNQSQSEGSQAELTAPIEESNSDTPDSSERDVTSLCTGKGEPIPSIESGCKYPGGRNYWITGTQTDALNYAGGTAYYLQFNVGNNSKSPIDYLDWLEVVDAGGATYRPMSPDAFGNPGGICTPLADGRISFTLNPHEYATVSACYNLPDGIHIVGIRGVGMFSEIESFRMNIDQVLEPNL